METWNLDGILVSKSSSSQWTISTISSRESLDSARPPRLLHKAGMNDASTVWKLGDHTICKIKLVIPGTTLEHVTLEHVRKQNPDFIIPEVYHHETYQGRYYLIIKLVSGITLAEAWAGMTQPAKSSCATQLAAMCANMSQWPSGSQISGVDGHNISDQFLSASRDKQTIETLRPNRLAKNCKSIGMDCAKLVFYHCDLGPGNIIVDPNTFSLVAIIDWETAGYVPVEWIRTKFTVSPGMDLDREEKEEMEEWRTCAQLALRDIGFEEVHDRWREWRKTC